jgi:hypothetical protein
MQNNKKDNENAIIEQTFNIVIKEYQNTKEMYKELTIDKELSRINEKIKEGEMRIYELGMCLQEARDMRDNFLFRKDIIRANISNAYIKDVQKWLDEQQQIVQMYSRANKV